MKKGPKRTHRVYLRVTGQALVAGLHRKAWQNVHVKQAQDIVGARKFLAPKVVSKDLPSGRESQGRKRFRKVLIQSTSSNTLKVLVYC